MTEQAVVDAIVAQYRAIYARAAETTSVEPGVVPGMLNRNRTGGEFGIWGHVLDDLVIEGTVRDGDGIWHLEISS